MEGTQKNKFSKILRFCLKSLSLVFVMVSAIIFVACAGASSSYKSDFDSAGRYRLNAVTLRYYDRSSNGSQNEFTGSFLVPMEYYRDESYDDMVKHADSPDSFTRDFDQSGSRPFYDLLVSNAVNADLNYGKLVYPDYTFWISGHIYQIHVAVVVENLVADISTANANAGSYAYYGPKNFIKLKPGKTLEETFRFSYRPGTSGTWLNANGFASAVFLSKNPDNDEIDVTTNPNDSYDKIFYLCFNPMLENGTVARKIRVKAVPNLGVDIDTAAGCIVGTNQQNEAYKTLSNSGNRRGESLYSNTISFNAYKMSFSAYSLNSATIDYGGLSYDTGKFYFYKTESIYSTTAKKYYLSAITGYFPEGRVVEVSRVLEDHNGTGSANGTDYALSSWSANREAMASLAIEATLPSETNFEYASKYGLIEDFDGGYHSLLGNTLSNCFAIKSYLSEDFRTTRYPYFDTAAKTNDNSKTTLFEMLNYGEINDYYAFKDGSKVASGNYRSGTIYVGSCSDFSGYVFYANFVRVDNFTLSGTIFDAEKILSFEQSKLSDVGYQVYNSEGVAYTEEGKRGVFSDYAFKITGLHYGDYVIFNKSETAEDGTELQYKFYGSEMSMLTIDGVDIEKVLCNTVSTSARQFGTVVTTGDRKIYLGQDTNSFRFNETTYYVEDGRVTDIHGNIYDAFKVQVVYNTIDISNAAILAKIVKLGD